MKTTKPGSNTLGEYEEMKTQQIVRRGVLNACPKLSILSIFNDAIF